MFGMVSPAAPRAAGPGRPGVRGNNDNNNNNNNNNNKKNKYYYMHIHIYIYIYIYIGRPAAPRSSSPRGRTRPGFCGSNDENTN